MLSDNKLLYKELHIKTTLNDSWNKKVLLTMANNNHAENK